jgi:uncharacterized protein (DUF488 family)
VRFFTIGYGGRKPDELVAKLKDRGVTMVVDVRLRPDRASMGSFTKASTPEKGIERLLADAGLGYVALTELGNPFIGLDDWADRYRRLLRGSGDLLIERLLQVPPTFCLMCAEKKAAECHRSSLADLLVARGWNVEHIE